MTNIFSNFWILILQIVHFFRWKKKEELQKASMEKEQQMLLCCQKKREKNIQKYNEEIQKKRGSLKVKLKKSKFCF